MLNIFFTVYQGRAPSEGSLSLDTSRAQRELISQLEAKNREIMREIARLRYCLFMLCTLQGQPTIKKWLVFCFL
jgi:hypothetical protein